MRSNVPREAGRARSVLPVVIAAALAWPAGSVAQTLDPPPPLRLGPGDAIRLVVENEPDLSQEFPVGTDGSVIVPLVGPVQVEGRDFEEVEREVRTGLGRELAAGMTVQVVPLFRVTVLGEVRVPGLHRADPSLTMTDVVAMSGGLTPLADRSSIELVRGGRTVLEADEEMLMSGGPPLRPGDRVVVGRVGWLRENLGIVIGTAGSLTVAILTGLIVR